MIKLGDLGNFKKVPAIVEFIINGDISALEKELQKGWRINAVIAIDEYIEASALTYAFVTQAEASIKWLVKNGADLNDVESPAFLDAVRYCDRNIVRFIAENGADINMLNDVKSDAFMEAIYGGKIDNLPLIEELGHTARKYGGQAFRSAVSDNNFALCEFFIKNGVDINYNKTDMVYPFKPTPLCVAARYGEIAMVKFLVENGADITMAEKDGMRPYSIAIATGKNDMAEYLKSLEPPEFHNLQNKLAALKSYKLPKSLFEFLQGEDLRLDLENCAIGFIEFFALVDTVEMKVGKQKLLRISKTVDNYELDFVYNPKTKRIACYDAEHKELTNIAPFEDFVKNTAEYITKLLTGELDDR